MDLYEYAEQATAWLDNHNGHNELQQTLRILKVAEEAGEAAQKWINHLNANPRRRGLPPSIEEVGDELGDVVGTALVAIASLGLNPEEYVQRHLRKAEERFLSERVDTHGTR